MLWRRILAGVVALGLLAHGLAVVRHHGVMLGAAMASAAVDLPSAPSAVAMLEADLGTICHAGALTAAADAAKSGKASSCPVCTGLASAFALAPSLVVVAAPPPMIRADAFVLRDQRATVQRFIRPASRGPPSLV